MITLNNLWRRFRARLRTYPPWPDLPRHPPSGGPRVFVVVEGSNDIQFLNRISRILHADDPRLPDLAEMERRGELIFVPFGGGDLSLP